MFAAIVLLTASTSFAAEARIVIADGAKTAAEADKKLAALKVPSTFHLPAGYPRVITSDSVKGLNPGLHIIVLGYCAAEDNVRILTKADEEVRAGIKLKHHAHMLKQLKKAVPGVYSKTVTTETAIDCPVVLGEKPASPPALVTAWSAVQQAPTSAIAWVKYGQALEEEGGLDAADYAYSVAYERDPKYAPAQHALYKLDFVGARNL